MLRRPSGSNVGANKAGPRALPPILKPAPVKLFTLTRSSNAQEAIRDTYASYVDDKIYQERLNARSLPPADSRSTSHPKPTRRGL
ncbi:unnamed protein product [Phytomonas sp. EM1]|nr:unnamed protein product [Phytomonas sp. EM1]|eukprot:CCW64856.1 unnamed protein product [Phytomonas sp. isolate EM1]